MVYTTENVTDTVGLMKWVNGAAAIEGSGILFPGIILAVFIIMVVRMLGSPENTPARALGASAFVAMILSVLARVLELVSTTFMTIWIAGTALCAIWMYLENKG